MAINHFYKADRSSVKNQKPGYRNRAWLALASWFTTLSEPEPGTFGAEAKTISDDHVFSTGKGFLECYAMLKSVEADGDSTGDPGALHSNWKPKFLLPGDSAELQALIEEGLANEELILLVEDANCPEGGFRQFGCECTPMYITSYKFTSGNSGDGKKGYAIEGETTCRFFYEGTVVLMP